MLSNAGNNAGFLQGGLELPHAVLERLGISARKCAAGQLVADSALKSNRDTWGTLTTLAHSLMKPYMGSFAITLYLFTSASITPSVCQTKILPTIPLTPARCGLRFRRPSRSFARTAFRPASLLGLLQRRRRRRLRQRSRVWSVVQIVTQPGDGETV